jgi:glycosyltransferase involved in cell wall biosynthesis
VFYPRESRINSKAHSIHDPEKIVSRFSMEYYIRLFLRWLYRGNKIQPSHGIVCMTEFTRDALERVYPLSSLSLPIIYPPVEISAFEVGHQPKRKQQIVTIGRFTPDKRQLEQIQLAAKLPEFELHLVGFVASQKYYKKCELLAKDMKNVHLHPNASFAEMTKILHESRYFLHSLVDEPFGITAVQAIAAGCMPVVHDSGGQREVVPYTRLRYQHMDEVPGLMAALELEKDHSFNMLLNDLLAHIKNNFNENIFHDRITQLLKIYTEKHTIEQG